MKAGRSLFFILANQKYFTNFLQFLVPQGLSYTEFLEKNMINAIAIHCNVKENLNSHLLISTPQNDVNKMNLVH